MLEAYGEWREFLRASYSPHTVRSYTQATFLYFRDGPGKEYNEHTTADIDAWLATFPYRSTTRRTYYQALKSFFGYCRKTGILDHDPTAAVRAPAVTVKVPEALTVEEMRDLVQAARRKGGMRPWCILLLFHTGLRLHETCALRWEDVRGDKLRVREAKGGKERYVPITPEVREVLDRLHEFSGPTGRIIPRAERTVWGWVHDAGKEAGIPGVHPHLLRSTTATVMLDSGAGIHQVARLLGHGSIKTTQKYAAVSDRGVREAARLLGRALSGSEPTATEA